MGCTRAISHRDIDLWPAGDRQDTNGETGLCRVRRQKRVDRGRVRHLTECRTLFRATTEILVELTGTKRKADEGLDGVFEARETPLEADPEWTAHRRYRTAVTQSAAPNLERQSAQRAISTTSCVVRWTWHCRTGRCSVQLPHASAMCRLYQNTHYSCSCSSGRSPAAMMERCRGPG